MIFKENFDTSILNLNFTRFKLTLWFYLLKKVSEIEKSFKLHLQIINIRFFICGVVLILLFF